MNESCRVVSGRYITIYVVFYENNTIGNKPECPL